MQHAHGWTWIPALHSRTHLKNQNQHKIKPPSCLNDCQVGKNSVEAVCGACKGSKRKRGLHLLNISLLISEP